VGELDTQVASARRHSTALRVGVEEPAKCRFMKCQSSSATVTNPDLIPADTNAKPYKFSIG